MNNDTLTSEEPSVCDKDEAQEEQEISLCFFSPQALKFINKRTNLANQKKYTNTGECYNMTFKMFRTESRLVKTLLFSYGFIQCSSKNTTCNLTWCNTHLRNDILRSIKPWQRINHFPRSWMITKKDSLYTNIDRASASLQYGKNCFNFIPSFFCTPLSSKKREELKARVELIEANELTPLIVKPSTSSLGRGIYFLKEIKQIDGLETEKPALITDYIDRPYLIHGLKWDMRIYVLVTSFHPLVVYIYADGLARFSIHSYIDRANNYFDVNAHLTNYSLNKSHADYIRNKDVTSENVGHKWTLGALLRELEKQEVDTELLMVRIEDIVIKTLLTIQGSVAAVCRKVNLHPRCTFELFGFDILVDEELKPWLLEVNLSPSLICDAPLDAALKTSLLCDVLNMALIPLVREKNIKNKHYNPSDEDGGISDDASTISDHSTAFSGVGDFYDVTMPSTSSFSEKTSPSKSTESKMLTENTSRKAPLAAKINKLRKTHLQIPKPTYSAAEKNRPYLARSKLHFDKMQTERLRRGSFIPIFPRSMTWNMYSLVLEDAGQERWDEDLYNRMMEASQSKGNNGGGTETPKAEITMEDILRTHEQLMDSRKYKSRSDLDPIVRDVLLKEALIDAERYKMKMYPPDVIPYPATLPIVRTPARRRTRSQTEAENERKRIREMQRQNAERNATENEPETVVLNGCKTELNEKTLDLLASVPFHQFEPTLPLL